MANASEQLKSVVRQRAAELWHAADKLKVGDRLHMDGMSDPREVLEVVRDDSLRSVLGRQIKVTLRDRNGTRTVKSTVRFAESSHVAEFYWCGERNIVTAIAVEEAQ